MQLNDSTTAIYHSTINCIASYIKENKWIKYYHQNKQYLMVMFVL